MPPCPNVNAANKYARDVVSGKMPACKWVKAACQRHLDDLNESKKKSYPYEFDKNKAERVCRFISRLPHIKGKWAGTKIMLEPWQQFIVCSVFGWLSKADGARRFRTVYVEVPRKNAKSTLTSASGLYMLTADGEGGAEIYSAATTRDQAKIIFQDAQAMARKSPDFRAKFGVEVSAHNMHVLSTSSKFEALSADSSTLDGLNVHFGAIDELHAHKTRAVYDVIETATGARSQPILWLITTAGSNRAGICYEVRTYLTKILDRVAVDETFFGIIYTIDTTEHTVIYQSSHDAIRRLEEKCNCNTAKIKMEGRLTSEDCVGHATKNSGIRADHVKTIQIDQSGQGGSATLVTSKTCLTGIQIEKEGLSKKERNGPKITETDVVKPIRDGERTEEKRKSISQTLSKDMASPWMNSTPYSKANLVDAEFVVNQACDSVSTTAILQEKSEAYCVNHATRLSHSLETLKRAYEKHSPTCKVRELKLGDQCLSITFPPDDWTDEASWKKANPNYGVSVYPDDLARKCAKAMQMPSAVNNFLTKHLNVWVSADESWMDMRAWERCGDKSLSIDEFEGEPCIIALDLASKVDIAAKMILFTRDIDLENGKKERHYYAFGRYYLPEDAAEDGRNSQYSGWSRDGRLVLTPGQVIDFEYIKDDLILDSSRFSLTELPYDPFQATQLSTELMAEGFPMVEMRPTVLNFSEPMKELEKLVLQGRFHHDGDPVLAWMVSNVVCHTDAKDNIYPRKERNENKIDGAVALIMALGRALVANGPKETSFWEMV